MPAKTNNTTTNIDANAATTAKKTVVKKRVVKKKVAKKEEEEVKPVVVEEQQVIQTPIEEIVEPPVEVTNTVDEQENNNNGEDNTESEESGEKKKTKKTMKKEDFIGKFEYLFSAYEEQLKAARKQPNQTVSLHKYLTSLKNDVYKILKLKKRKTGENSAASGFMKPVSVSNELRSFLGNLNADEEITRVLVTRKLCEYIKQNSLQQNEDKRFIIPDSKLKSLFAIAENDTDTKLSYYGIQQLIQRHISKKTVENTSA
mgnify:CR=1 FL=1